MVNKKHTVCLKHLWSIIEVMTNNVFTKLGIDFPVRFLLITSMVADCIPLLPDLVMYFMHFCETKFLSGTLPHDAGFPQGSVPLQRLPPKICYPKTVERLA